MVRHKNRYMIIEINQGAKKDSYALQLKPPSLHYSIMSMVQQLHGDFGVAAIMAGFTAKYCNEKTRIAIIRCRHGPHRLVASSLPCATIKHCFKFIKNYQQRKFEEYCVGLKNDEEKEALKKALMNLDPILSIH